MHGRRAHIRGRGPWAAAWMTLLATVSPALAADVWTPTLSVALEERYDDDVLLRASPGAASGQFMTKLSPEAGIEGRARTWSLDLDYAPDLFVRHGSGRTSIDHRFSLDAAQRVGPRVSLRSEARVWYVSDPTSLPRMGMARSLVPVLYGVGNLSAGWSASRRWLLRAEYRFEGARIEEPGRTPGLMHQPSLEARYRLTPRTDLGVNYRAQSFHFEGRQARSHGPAAVFRHRFSRLITGTAVGGASYYLPDDGGPGGWSPRLTLALDGTSERWIWGLAAGHDLVGASGFSTALWADFVAASVGWNLTRHLQLRGVGNLFRNGPAPAEGIFSLAGEEGGVVSQGYGVGLTADWKVAERWALQLQVTRIGQVGTVGTAAPELTRNIAAVRAVFTPWD